MKKGPAVLFLLSLASLSAAPIFSQPSPSRGEPMHSDFLETPLTLEVDGLRFPARLTVPAAGDPASAILLIPGSLFIDVDGDYPSWNVHPHMYADLARQLAARGHAVLRYAKPGPGTGTETVDPERAQAEEPQGAVVEPPGGSPASWRARQRGSHSRRSHQFCARNVASPVDLQSTTREARNRCFWRWWPQPLEAATARGGLRSARSFRLGPARRGNIAP